MVNFSRADNILLCSTDCLSPHPSNLHSRGKSSHAHAHAHAHAIFIHPAKEPPPDSAADKEQHILTTQPITTLYPVCILFGYCCMWFCFAA